MSTGKNVIIESFPITSVSRSDLEMKGFDTDRISNEQMERLASKMADDYVEQMFWISMEILAECLGLPKRRMTRIITAKLGPAKVKTLIADEPGSEECWWAVAGSHSVHHSRSDSLKSGVQLNNVETDDMFTYYGNGTSERPDNVADMETLTWLLRDK